MKIFIALILFSLTKLCYGQDHGLVFVKVIKSEKDVVTIYDSLQMPLLIYQNKIYVIHSECITRDMAGDNDSRNAGGNSTDRNAGSNSKDRRAGGNANDRNAGGNSNDRNTAGNSGDRNGGGNANDRSSGGNASDRNDGGNTNDRNASSNSGNRSMDGVISKITCSIDNNGKLVIFFHNMEIDKSARVYYNNSYLTLKNNFFKLKKS